MLRLLIVDDEKVTRDSLKEYLPWEELGIGTVETAKNGLAALELAHRSKPDIVITDVRMPKMDGIEFAVKIRELYPDVKIIFLSGYSDKEYLKSAIHLKAINYIEKPVNRKEIQSAVRSSVELCREETVKTAETEKLKSSLAESIPLIRQEIALELVKENADLPKLLEKYDHDHSVFRQQDKGLLIPACIAINWKTPVVNDSQDVIRKNIAQLLCGNTIVDCLTFLAGFQGSERIVLVTKGVSNDFFKKILEAVIVASDNHITASIGVGYPVEELELLPLSYMEAAKAVERQFYYGEGNVYHPEDVNGRHYIINQDLYSTFRDFLKKDDEAGTRDLVKKLTEQIGIFKDPDTNHVKNIYFTLLLRIFEAARRKDLIDFAVEHEGSYIWQEIDDIKTLSRLSEYIFANLDAIFIRNEANDAISRKTYEIINYIHDNYPNKNLSIKMIAEKTYLCQTYLCSFFKKSTGKTINEYINETRIEKARELLKENRVKLYEIATDIGFADANYFSTIFKKYIGCTPSEYREKNYL